MKFKAPIETGAQTIINGRGGMENLRGSKLKRRAKPQNLYVRKCYEMLHFGEIHKIYVKLSAKSIDEH